MCFFLPINNGVWTLGNRQSIVDFLVMPIVGDVGSRLHELMASKLIPLISNESVFGQCMAINSWRDLNKKSRVKYTMATKKVASPKKAARAQAKSPPVEGLAVSDFSSEDSECIELVFGFVGPTGIDLDKVCEALRCQLRAMQYEAVEIRLSDLISVYMSEPAKFANSFERISTLMDRGTRLREATNQADIVARLAMAAVRDQRVKRSGEWKKPARKIAYLVRSFKRPEEVELFRQVYGKAFNLISVYASRSSRTAFLKKIIGQSLVKNKGSAEELAISLINRDHNEEGKKLGQRVGKTFPLADLFVTSDSRPELEGTLKRFVSLLFGNPYISPTRDEQAMYFAKAAALRSLDLSRQVGAAVVSADGDLLSTGCNEVPKFGGGLYWGEDQHVHRDFERGSDANVAIKREIIEDSFDRMKSRKGLLAKASENELSSKLADDALFNDGAYLKDSQLFDVIEFGRAVHAEMDAITQAARLGVSLKGSRLFCTTFPCHICARHIVSSGITDVVFVEPYEKSRASELFGDSISVEPDEHSTNKVNFRAFVGVAPRRYSDVFEVQASRKNDKGKIRNPDSFVSPRIKRTVFTYVIAEALAVAEAAKPPTPTRSIT